MHVSQGFLTLGNSNWTICSLLNWFCHIKFPLFYPAPMINHFLLPWRPVAEKGNHPKVNETQGFLILGHSNWTICSLVIWFCHITFPPFYPAPHNKPFLITPTEKGLKMGKRKSPKSEWDTGVSDLGPFKLNHLQPVKLILFQKKSNLFTMPPIINDIFIMGRQEGGRQQGQTMGKGNSSKLVNSNGWSIQTGKSATF